jgi:C4-dicarboxylate transporter, DctQ subunit
MIRLFQILRGVERFVLAWSVLAIAGLLVANVICRSLLGFSLAFAQELAQFLMIAVTFVGLSHAAGCGRHIRMTAFYDQLPKRWRRILMIFISASTCLLLLAVAAYSIRYILTVHFLGSRSPVLQVPFFLIYAVVPLGILLAAVQYGLTAYKNWISHEVHLSFDRRDEYERVSGEER